MHSPKLPNFFIIGAAKAGTSALWHFLKQNPQVFMPKSSLYKEPSYYSPIDRKRAMTDAKYASLFSEADTEERIGEASTSYISDPGSAALIHQHHPDAKIIAILRNPIDRAYSLYNWMVQEGYEWASFEQAIELEERRSQDLNRSFLKPQYPINYLYLKSGLYSQQLRRYFAVFPREQVLALEYGYFKNQTQGAYDKICSFLEVGSHPVAQQKVNPSVRVVSPKLQFAMRKLNNARELIWPKPFTAKGRRDLLLSLMQSNEPPKPMKESTRDKLRLYYEGEVAELSSMLNWDLSHWR